ncbi:MAG TPA: rhodanese-like domain-containing protein, partial [Tepidisphaeraceae bacterium]|nr:rhodanese-like domain-containing protein [Tepidisphaeraceae bacterium]
MVGDEKSRQVVVIDPTRDVDEYIRIAAEHDLHITQVLETHVHADYVSGSVELKARLCDTDGPQPQIVCSGMGGAQWAPPYADRLVRDGDEVRLGSIRLRAVHTPGHTPEHVCWVLFDETRSTDTPWLMFTGDFVFVGDVGRPDLLGPDQQTQLARLLYQSIFQKLSSMPDFLEIYPGHGAGSLCGKALGSRRSSSLGFERRFNRSLQPAAEPQWTSALLNEMPPAPPYFRRMKQINARGPEILGPQLPGQTRLSPAQLYERICSECLVLDVRSKEAVAAAHVPGSINIPLDPNLPSWAGWVLPYDRRLVIVPASAADMPGVVTHLIRIGLDQIEGFLEGGIEGWENAGYPVSRLETIGVQELHEALSGGADPPFVLDVRSDSEWGAGHIRGAHHLHAGLLKDRLNEVPGDRPVVVICGTGYRASIAASVLKSSGYERVGNVLGGMTAWHAAGLPTTRD